MSRVLRVFPYALGLLVFVAYSALSLLRFRRFDTPSWDNAIFEEAIRGYARLGSPIVDIKGPGFNLLGDHFSPLIVVVAPFYRVFPHAQTLLVFQAAVIAVSVAVLAHVAMKRLGAGPGIALGLAYGLSFGFQAAVVADFHEVVLAVPLLTFAGVAYLRRDWAAVMWWSLALLLVKEDLGLTVAAVGLVMWWCGERRRGIALAAGGLIAMVLIVLVVIPAFNPNGTYDYFGRVGTEGGSGPVGVFLDGWNLKGPLLLALMGITGLAALRSPWVLLVLPTLAWRFVSDNTFYWSIDWHYSLPLMPIVFVALIDGVERARADGPSWFFAYARYAPYVGLAVVLAMGSWWPLGQLADSTTYSANPRAASAREAMGLITEGASVVTDIGLITHLASDHSVYWVGTIGDVVPDYVLIDAQRGGWSPMAPAAAAYGRKTFGVPYETVFDRDGFTLARRTP